MLVKVWKWLVFALNDLKSLKMAGMYYKLLKMDDDGCKCLKKAFSGWTLLESAEITVTGDV